MWPVANQLIRLTIDKLTHVRGVGRGGLRGLQPPPLPPKKKRRKERGEEKREKKK